MRVPQSFVEGVIVFLMMIPIVIFYLVKWIVIGVVFLIIQIKRGVSSERNNES